MFRETAILVIGALVVAVLVRTFLIQAFYIPSSSMENTLRIDDRVLASKLTTSLGGVSRGEVVVFRDPGDWLSVAACAGGLVAAVDPRGADLRRPASVGHRR